MNRPDLLSLMGELDIRQTILSQPRWRLICDDSFCEFFASWNIPAHQIINLKLLSRTLQSGKYDGRLAIVCVAGDEALFKRILREYGHPSLGLFGNLVLRMAALAPPEFSAENYAPPEKTYGIFCLPRAGSTLLTGELSSIGAGAPAEHFRDHIIYLLQHRRLSHFSIRKWWSVLELAQARNGIFGTKIVWEFYKVVAEHMTSDERRWLEEKFGGMTLVYLERRDKVGQAVSDFIARQTDVWHLWPQYLANYDVRLSRVPANIDAILTTYREFVSEERKLKSWLKSLGSDLIEIQFDDVTQNPKRAVRTLATELGVVPPDEYDDVPLKFAPTTSPLHEKLAGKLRERLAITGDIHLVTP
jgi:LPS sulfotransferase NodH